ncbi:MAG TPA: MFS transporter [Jatrophihabitantaceae bacterium]|nr:MFS transporter [Jatrophihabitantaceae bacterium]
MLSSTAAAASRREWFGMTTLLLPTFVVAIDLFVMLLALPKLSADLGADSNQQLWITDMYGFLLAGFLFTMGTLGDRIGRRRLLLYGAAAFAAASLLAAYAVNPGMLIAARALLGVAGATLGPSTLALIANLFRDPKQQAVAFGMWGMTFTLGALLGPILGGVLLEHFWWGSVFLVAAPVMAVVIVVGPTVLPEYRDSDAARLDPTSVLLSLAALLPFVYGIKQIARDGWEVVPVVALLVGLTAGAAFLRRQNRLTYPLLDLNLLCSKTIGTALSGQLTYTFMSGGFMLFVAMYLQLVRGMSTLEAGAAMIPGMAGGAIGFMVAPKIASRVRPSAVIAGGLLVVAATLAVLTQAGPDTAGAALLIAGFPVMAFFGAPMAGLGTGLVVGSAPPEKAGSAGSLAQMANEFGATLGFAILGTVGTTVYRHEFGDGAALPLSHHAAVAAHDSLAGATTAARQLPSEQARAVLADAHGAFASGMHAIAGIGSVLVLATAALVAVRLRHVPPIGAASNPADNAVSADTAELEQPAASAA